MGEERVDRLLVTLALLAPLALVLLGKWQASLDTWYVPQVAGESRYLDEAFVKDAEAWLHAEENSGITLYAVVDDTCPCTTATLTVLRAALAQSARKDIRLEVRNPDETAGDRRAWQTVVARLPSIPTLLAADGAHLLYAGPVVAGSFCTTGVQRVLGISVLQARQAGAVLNSLDKGCYCARRPPAE